MRNKVATAKIIGFIMTIIFGLPLLLLIAIYVFIEVAFAVINRG